MNLGQIRSRVKRQLPQATGESIDDPTINFEINHSVDEINLIAQCYKSTFTFQTVANQQQYSLSTVCPGYLGIDKTGVWFFDDNGDSKYLYTKTKRWLDLNIINWRDQGSTSVPTWVWTEEDVLGFQPAPSGVNDVTVDGLVISTPMDNDNNYPWWNQTNEFTTLRCFDNAICAYAVWKLAPAVMDKEGRNYYEELFYKEVKKASIQVKRKWNMTSDLDYYIRPDISGGFLPS